MALFGNSDSGRRLPEYRVAALASLDLEDLLQKEPFSVARPGSIEWMVAEDEDGHLVTRGAIRIPVEMYFTPNGEEDDPDLERIVINGRRALDNRAGADEEEGDNNYGIDPTAAQAQSFVRYRSNLER